MERQNVWSSKIYQDWRKSVFERDGYKCVMCGSEKKLHAHHIHPFYEYIEKRYDLNNGQTLCCSCHVRIENTGKKASDETKLKMSLKQKGRRHTKEACDKIRLSKIGSSISEEIRIKISNTLKGNVPWSKGVKFSEEHKKKLSEARKGKIPWNKGTKCSDETKMKISISKKLRQQ